MASSEWFFAVPCSGDGGAATDAVATSLKYR